VEARARARGAKEKGIQLGRIKLLPELLLLLSFTLNLTIVTRSLLLNLPATEANRLQLVLNSAARAVTKTPKFHRITAILKYLHWLN